MAGAYANGTHLEVTDDWTFFCKKTGILFNQSQFAPTPFRPDNVSGVFGESFKTALLEFCRLNPRYHIISATDGVFENKYAPNRNLYMLAEGDNNPNLVLNLCLTKNPDLLSEEMLEEALAMGASVNGSDKGK